LRKRIRRKRAATAENSPRDPERRCRAQNWLAQPVEKETYRLEILLKLYFSTYADPDVMLGHLSAFEESHLRQLEILNLFQKELEGILDLDENHCEILRVMTAGRK
jgi:hypothetical protein